MRLLILLLLIPFATLAQNSNWSRKYKPQKAIIENKGQFGIENADEFSSEIGYAFPEQNQSTYFTKNGVVFEFIEKGKVKKTQEEKNWRTQRKQKGFTFDEFNAFERVGHRLNIKKEYLHTTWLNSNPNVVIEALDQNSFYHSYLFSPDGKEQINVSDIKSYQKLVYKDLYPNIDVVYELHAEQGIKYSVILYPGADLSQVQLKYSGSPTLNSDGNILTETMFGNVIDHAPVTFYESDHNNIINSEYKLSNGVISFKLDSYDVTKTVVIDPWTQTPAFATNWDCIWECETDAAGNAYIIGGVMPMQLLKYDAAGALQWTYNTPYDTTSWLGTFATDDLGNSYVTLGSTAAIQMVNTAGVMVWNNPSPGGLFGSTEFWNISFNCDQTKLVIGGTGGTLPPLPYIYDVDMATGNVTSSVQVTGGDLIPTQEVRAITACNNSKYYWLSHDSIGYVHQDFSNCPSGSSAFHTDNGFSMGYKCEDWRYNNTGIEAIASYGNYIFINRGNEIQKRDFNTAAVIATATIPGGVWNTGFGGNSVENSGIAIDDCGNIYVGSKTGVIVYDQNLTQLTSYATTFTVYDVEVATGGNIIAAGSTGDSGSGTRSSAVQSFAAAACGQLATTCCDATICQPNALCDSDAPFNLDIQTPGGTFSGTGITNTTTGTFDPSVAGPGTHTVYYSIACGMDSTTITVSTCASLTLCLESNGDITVTGGTAPYTWAEGMSTVGCVSGFSNCAGLFTFTDPGPPTLTWSDFATGGATQTPPAGADSIQVTDNFGNVVSTFSASTLAPCTITTCDLSITSGINTDETCDPLNDGEIDVTFTGTGTYDITIGATTYYSGVGAGTYNISPLADGSYTVTVTDSSDPTCTEDVVVVIAAGPSSSDATISAVGAVCENDAPFNLTAATGGGTWSGTGITDPVNGTFDPATAGAGGPYTITYTISGACGDVDTEDITVTASEDASFSYSSGSYCLSDPDPTPTVTGTTGGNFTIDNGGTINVSTGEINIGASGANSYIVTYTTTGACPDTQTFAVTLISAADATITAPATSFCESDPTATFTAPTGGGTWSATCGACIDPVTGVFDPSLATVGPCDITYTITGSCGDTDTESITINPDQDATFSYGSSSYCLADPNPIPTITGTTGGSFVIDNLGVIDAVTGEIDITASGVNSYIVTYTTAGPCADVQTFNVDITASSDATIDPVSAVCQGSAPFNLTAATGGGTWSGNGIIDPVNGTFDPSDASVVVGGAGNTITYTITGACGDVDTETVIVNAQDDPSFSYSATAYCLSDPDPFATVAGTGGGSFSITAPGVINTANGQIDLASSGAGSFDVQYLTGGACPDSMTVTISISAAFDATIDPVAAVCENDAPFNLTAANTGGTWSGTGITDPVNGTFDPATAGAGGPYTITYTISGSCGDTDTETITVTAADDASFSYSSASFCDSDPNPSATLGAGATTGGSYSIDNAGTINAATGEIDLAASGAGSYTVTYTTTGTCPDVQTFAVTITTCTAPSAGFSVSDDLICEGDCITFTESSTGPPTGWLWTFPGGTPASSTNQDPGTVCFNIPGTHDIQLIVTNAFGSDTTTVTITVTPTPVVSAGPDESIIIGESVVLTATGTGGTYTWTDASTLSCGTCQSTTATPQVTTGYLVTLVDSAGCIATDSITVDVTYVEEVGVPNAFSPNGDGINDVLYIDGAGFSQVEFKIYNRYGQLVFETTDTSIGWDGTSLDGKQLNPGTFAYVLDYSFVGADGGIKSGNITLIK